jgi:hypothetical protein
MASAERPRSTVSASWGRSVMAALPATIWVSGLRDVVADGGAPEAAAVGDGHRVLQLPQPWPP